VTRALLPEFLEALPAGDADFYVELCENHARIAGALATHPRTLVHGDLRRANIAYVGDDVVLFDWELASSAPAARDLAWYWFLQFWAYPGAEQLMVADRRGGIDEYLEAFAHERPGVLDRNRFDTGCDLAWLSVFCQIGFCLADPLASSSPPEAAISRARRTIAEAIDHARRIWDRHAG
jgi:hypothetical protein